MALMRHQCGDRMSPLRLQLSCPLSELLLDVSALEHSPFHAKLSFFSTYKASSRIAMSPLFSFLHVDLFSESYPTCRTGPTR